MSRSASRSLSPPGAGPSRAGGESSDSGEEVRGRGGGKGLGLDLSDSEEDEFKEQTIERKEHRISSRKEESEGEEEMDREPEDEREEVGGNDFEMMMRRKKEENKRHRRKKDIDVINDNDDAIAKMIADMRIAAKEDRDLNLAGQPAARKLSMHRRVMQNLRSSV